MCVASPKRPVAIPPTFNAAIVASQGTGPVIVGIDHRKQTIGCDRFHGAIDRTTPAIGPALPTQCANDRISGIEGNKFLKWLLGLTKDLTGFTVVMAVFAAYALVEAEYAGSRSTGRYQDGAPNGLLSGNPIFGAAVSKPPASSPTITKGSTGAVTASP